MAKAKSREPTPAATSRAARLGPRQADPERWNRLLIIGGVAAVVLLVIGIIVYGYWSEEIKPLTKTVVRVNDREISLGHLQRRVALSVDDNSFLLQQGSEQILAALPETTAVQLQREAKLLEAADELGISVTDEEIESRILDELNLPEGSDPEAISKALAEKLEQSGLHQDEYYSMIEAQLLEQAVRDDFTGKAPAAEEQVKARWIVVPDEAAAIAVLTRLNNGADFAAVARDVSTDTNNAQQGGAVDWRIRGTFNDSGVAIEDFLFNASEGDRSQPLQGVSGLYIVELVNREANRNLSEEQKGDYGSRELNKWLDELAVTHRVETDLTEEDILRVLQNAIA